MTHDEFLSIPVAAEMLAELKQPLSVDRLRALIDAGKLPCAVYWLVQHRWLYVHPKQAIRHEVKGWPEWAANRPDDLYPDEANPHLICFTDDRDHSNLCDRLGRGGGLHLAEFRPGLFVPAAAISALANRGDGGGKNRLPATPWRLIEKPVDMPGYRRPLYELLEAAYAQGESVPRAADVIAQWSKDKPPEIIEVRSRGIVYHGGGEMPSSHANSKAIGQAIKRLVVFPENKHSSK